MSEGHQCKCWLEEKEKRYLLLFEQLSTLLDDEVHPLPVLANTAALLWQAMPDINWAGFYLNTGKQELLLGPFQGKAACIRIPFSRGVCGAAAREERTQLVRDVHQFPGHIACDSASSSEIVVPLMHGGQLLGVLDIDSPVTGRFDEEDRAGLERIAALLSRHCRWEDWRL